MIIFHDLSTSQRAKMSSLFCLCCGLLEVCAVLVRAACRRFRDFYSSHQERLSGKKKNPDSVRQKHPPLSFKRCVASRFKPTKRTRLIWSIFPRFIIQYIRVESECKNYKTERKRTWTTCSRKLKANCNGNDEK